MRRALDEGRAAAARTGVGFGLMVAANRHHGPEAATDMARLAVELAGDGVVSFGLDGDEAAFPPAPFAEAFALARAGGLLSTPHAGELLGWESVADAMTVLGADPILHGVRALESPDLVARLAARGVSLDVCPTSNHKLGVVAPDDHPLRALLDAGVRCSLNADDPLLFGTTLLEEYEHGRSACSLSDRDLAAVARTSVTSSGAPDALKARALAGIDEWIGVASR